MNVLHTLLIIVGILGMYYVYNGYTEGFMNNVNYGIYPVSEDTTLVSDEYPEKKPQQLSKNSYEQNYSLQPKTLMSSYDQVTNNFKSWSSPDNGYCSPADFCNAMYDKKSVSTTSVPMPNDTDIRVNYYNISN